MERFDGTHTHTQRKTHTEHDTTSKAFITTVFAIHHAISCRCNSILMQNLLLLKNSTTPLKLCVDEHFPGIIPKATQTRTFMFCAPSSVSFIRHFLLVSLSTPLALWPGVYGSCLLPPAPPPPSLIQH